MRYRISHGIYLLVIFLSNLLFAQHSVKLTVVIHTTGLSDSDVVFISGNIPELGQWQPDIIPLKKRETGIWEKTIVVPYNSELEFKFTLGQWDREALTDSGEIPQNHFYKAVNDTILNFDICCWKIPGPKNKSGQITGDVKYHSDFISDYVRPRNIIVWLPPGYDKGDNRYPVLYMQDGQNIFDPLTSAFGVDWQVDEIADSLIRINSIYPIIIVGIYNTPERSNEYMHNDTGRAYMKFIVDELKPFIDKNYSTLPDRDNTATAGASLGGLISFMLVWEYPEIFSKAACISPAFKIETIDYVSQVKKYSGVKKQIKFYFICGGVGLEKKLQPGIDEMLTTLIEKGYKENEDFIWKQFINDEHSEMYWGKRFYISLQFFFGMN